MVTTINIEVRAGHVVAINANTAEPIEGLHDNKIAMLLKKLDIAYAYGIGYQVPIEHLKGLDMEHTCSLDDVHNNMNEVRINLNDLIIDNLLDNKYTYHKKNTIDSTALMVYRNSHKLAESILSVADMSKGKPYDKHSKILITIEKQETVRHKYYILSGSSVVDITKYCTVINLNPNGENRQGMRIEDIPVYGKYIIHHMQYINIINNIAYIVTNAYSFHSIK